MATGGAKDVDGRSDLYSLACVAWYLLTGRPIFQASSVMKLLMKHVQEEPPPLASIVKDIPLDLEAVLLHCLAKNPDDRLTSADELATSLEALGHESSWSEVQAISWWDVHGNTKSAETLPMLTEQVT